MEGHSSWMTHDLMCHSRSVGTCRGDISQHYYCHQLSPSLSFSVINFNTLTDEGITPHHTEETAKLDLALQFRFQIFNGYKNNV